MPSRFAALRRGLPLGAALALTVAACGSSPDTSTGTGDPPTSGDPVSTTASAPTPTLTPSATDRASVDPAAPVAETVRALNQVGWDLWAHHPDLAPDANAVISPSSIGHALLMARAAADEPTAAAIDTTLGFPAGGDAHQGWNALSQAMAADAAAEEDLTLVLADRIWPRVGVEPSQEWIDLLASHHGATVQPLDFAGDEPGSRQLINDWVGDQTRGLIPELLPAGFLSPDTVLVLTDTVYFKGRWQQVFGKYDPVTAPFTRLDGSEVEVELMRHLELPSPRGAGNGYVGAEIPYAGGTFSMLVIVPDQGRFGEVRDRLGPDLLEEIDASFTTGPFELLLPAWEDETAQLDLVGWLTTMGAAPGHYPGIDPNAFLEAAVHGADIKVDDWGTVAAAATALGFDESGADEPGLTVAADQPFLYLIRHRASGLVLFLGQVTDPTSQGG